jgi:hypothetical protein
VNSASVRALLPQTVFRLLREGAPELAGRLANRYAEIEKPFRLGWVPAELYLSFLDETRRGLGDVRFRALYSDAVLGTVRTKALRGFIETGIRLLGSTPHSLLKWTPRLWNKLFDGMGEIEHFPEPQPHVVWRGYPPEFIQTGTSVLAFVGAFDALFALTRTQGNVTVERGDGQVIFTIYVE